MNVRSTPCAITHFTFPRRIRTRNARRLAFEPART
jgi:hypothetical protein